jgi:hypothetical protein
MPHAKKPSSAVSSMSYRSVVGAGVVKKSKYFDMNGSLRRLNLQYQTRNSDCTKLKESRLEFKVQCGVEVPKRDCVRK